MFKGSIGAAGLAAALLLVPAPEALAQNKSIRADWGYSMFPSSVFRYTGFATCQAAVDAMVAAFEAQNPGAIRCGAAVCPGPSEYQGKYTMHWRSEFGPCNGMAMATPQCNSTNFNGQTPIHDPVTNEQYCEQFAYNRAVNNGDCPTCVANPINPATGNKFQREQDYAGSGPFPLKFVRFYNSFAGGDSNAGLGPSWTHNYNRRLVLIPGPAPSLVSAYRGDGKVIPYERSGGLYVTDAPFTETLQQTATGWSLRNNDDEVEVYDAGGRLVSITNRAGLVQTLAYDANGRLQTVTDPFGNTLTFTRNAWPGSVLSVSLPGGSQIGYAYNPHHRLQAVTHADTKVREYIYNTDLNAELNGIKDENGSRFSTYTYSFGSAVSSERAGGVDRVEVEYPDHLSLGARNPVVKSFIASGVSATRTYTFQSAAGVGVNNAVTGAPCPSCGPAARTYDGAGNVLTSTDWNGNRTDYGYDGPRKLETSRTEGLTSAGAATPGTRTVSTQWHATFRLPTVVAEPLRMTTNTYDGDGTLCGARGALCSRSVQATSDANGSQGFSATPVGAPRVWTYTYNANGQVLTVNGPRTDVADVTTYTYYANNDADVAKRGQLATLTNAAGHTTSVTAYNAHGQPLSMVDANGLVTTMSYDLRQRLTSRTVGSETTGYEYDAAGQLVKVTLPDGSYLSYTYDAAHRLTALQDNLGNRIAYTLDLAGNRTKEEVFDPANALSQTRSRVYSSINRLFQELGAQNQTTEYAYDGQGNLTQVKDPLNRTTVNAYDELNRLRQVTDPASGVTQYGYNGLDALVQVTDPRNLATSYSIDGLSNLLQQTSPDTGITSSTYDAAGNLATQTDAKGQVTTYAYDALNRVTLIGFHDGSKQLYAYDQGANGIGRLTSIEERDAANAVTSAIAYAYDLQGRVTSETRTLGAVAQTVGYSFDGAGRLSGMTYPSGRTLAYGFDAAGRVSQITTVKDGQSQVVVQNVSYQPFGGVKGFTLGNGQVYTRGYDQDGRVASYTLGAQAFAVGYDAASRVSFISDTANPANSNTYGYDALDRLTQAVLPASSMAYGYDAVGNRSFKTVGTSTDTYAYGATSNRLASISGGSNRSFVFDANGSTTSDGLNTYAYDVRGRMKQATSAIGTTSYQVNALGQRVRKTGSQGDTVFVYDRAGRLIVESDPAGAPRREYLYLGEIPVGVVSQ